MMINRLFILLLLITLQGCSPLSPTKAQPMSVYNLHESKKVLPTLLRSKKVIYVAHPTTNPSYSSAKMVYITKPYSIHSFAKNRWVSSPSNMILPLIRNAIDKKRYFYAVTLPPSMGKADYRLNTRIVKLHQDFSVKPSKYAFEITAELIDVKTNEVVAYKYLRRHEKAKSDNPYGGVIAANKIVASTLAQVADFCVKTVQQQ